MRYSKWIVLLCIALAVYGFERILHVTGATGIEPAVTAGAFFGFIATELWGLSKIKRDESKQEQEEEQDDVE